MRVRYLMKSGGPFSLTCFIRYIVYVRGRRFLFFFQPFTLTSVPNSSMFSPNTTSPLNIFSADAVVESVPEQEALGLSRGAYLHALSGQGLFRLWRKLSELYGDHHISHSTYSQAGYRCRRHFQIE